MKAATILRVSSRIISQRNLSARLALTRRQRRAIYAKTAGTCHVCGGPLGRGWQADHVVPPRRGGSHSLDNYLPACRVCNALRRGYDPAVLRSIIQMGVYVKHEMRQRTKLGRLLLELARKRATRSRDRRKRGW